MGIDDYLPDQWPRDAASVLDSWKQGDLLKGEFGVWLGPGGATDPTTGVTAGGHGGEFRAMRASLSDTGYYALTSQTCDVAVSGPGKRHPFVQVSPVRDIGAAFARDKVALIQAGEVVEYVYLTNPPLSGAQWAVDLRLSVPISKSVLAGASPVSGMKTFEDEVTLSQRIANKYERPALHDLLAGDLTNALDRCISRARGTQSWCDDVEQFRMFVEGSRLQPKRVRLLVITDAPFSPSERKPLRDEWKTFKGRLVAAGIRWEPISFATIKNLSIDKYRDSLPMNIPALRKGKFA